MPSTSTSLAVILAGRGVALELRDVYALPTARVVRADLVRGVGVSCVTATLEHEADLARVQATLRAWAGTRGWAITVAPLPRAG